MPEFMGCQYTVNKARKQIIFDIGENLTTPPALSGKLFEMAGSFATFTIRNSKKLAAGSKENHEAVLQFTKIADMEKIQKQLEARTKRTK